MKSTLPARLISLLCLSANLVLPVAAHAAAVALATAPMATSTPTPVHPNVMLMMDDSGSMGWDYLPDNASNFSSKYGYNSSQCNGVYYDPSITYAPPVNFIGNSFTNSTFTNAWNDGYNTGSGTTNLSSSFTTQANNTGVAAYYYKYSGSQTSNALKDYFNTNSTFYKECNSSINTTPGSTVFTKVTISSATTSYPKATTRTDCAGTSCTFAEESQNFANWYSYYRIRINMMKTATGKAFLPIGTDYRVGFATMNNNGGSDFISPVIFNSSNKSTWYNMLYATNPSNSTPLLGALADIGKMYAGKLSTKNNVTVTDPIEYSCQQNFTILTTDGYWNSQTGDTKLDGSTPVGNQDGTANRPMYDGATVGSTWTNTYTRNSYTTKSSSNCSNNQTYLKTTPQTGSCTASSSTASCTPASWTSGTSTTTNVCAINTASTSTPVLQSSVQSTSGGTSNTLADIAYYYYNTDLRTSALNNCTGVRGTNVCDNNVFISASDNNTQQHMTTFTLGLGARGRMVYSSSYNVDTAGDFYAVKLGSTASSSVCTWQTAGSVCNWPIPNVSGIPENIDDLWHAAVNGHGAYFNATDPTSLSQSLSNTLAGINARKGAAAAAATSTLNPVAGNNFAYVASYTTLAWKGNLESRGINIDTGAVSENATWCVEDVVGASCSAPSTTYTDTSGGVTIYDCVTPNATTCAGGYLVAANTLDAAGQIIPAGCHVPMATACSGRLKTQVSDFSDARNIYTVNSAGAALTPFLYANLSATNQAYFSSPYISTVNNTQTNPNPLNQWSSLSTSQKTAAAGANLVNYLRGQKGYELNASIDANKLYRTREAVLGDALESQPAYVGPPVFSYPYPGYSAFKSAQASRAANVYMGTNDGMMHAFAATTGLENWAYVPSMVIPNLFHLASDDYATNHLNYVNGSPVTSDVCTANCSDAANAVWKTILVAGLNAGGRGYYALDITNPTTPALLWEFKPSSDSDLGYTYGAPVVTRKTDGTWVVLVTSGYDNGTLSSNTSVNNNPTGSGIGYLYVLNAGTGAIISKISTTVGTAANPSGLAKIAGWNNEPAGNTVGYVYGGDLLGNLWRFDINNPAHTTGTTGGSVMQLASLYSDGTTANTAGTLPQPIMTTPVLGNINGKRVVYIGTGKYLEPSDLSNAQKQTQYGIMDNDATAPLINPRTTLTAQTLTASATGTATRTVSNNLAAGGAAIFSGNNRGWYVDFPDTGERANIDAKLIQGTLAVPTIVPSTSDCSPGGYGWLNFFNYRTGGAVDTNTNLASSKYDATIVGVNVVYIGGTPKISVVTSNNPTPQPDESVPFSQGGGDFVGTRVLWRELIP